MQGLFECSEEWLDVASLVDKGGWGLGRHRLAKEQVVFSGVPLDSVNDSAKCEVPIIIQRS